MNHQNKLALVTGGSRGLGHAIALKLAAEGADVILTYRGRRQEAEDTVRKIEALGRRAAALALDVSHVSEFAAFRAALVDQLEKKFQRKNFDFLINNAGINVPSAFMETTEADVDQLYTVHFKGTFFLTQTLVPLIAEGGRIVNTSSGLARFAGGLHYIAYASMKGAIEVFTRYLAKELGPRKITVNVIAPGVTATDFTADSLNKPGVAETYAKNIAMGRVGQPEDIAGAVNLLCAADAGWITAQRLEASGGMLL
jgi:NAD(P)-dependent dehydrogenase (short-subunit alcohol dehydrogenase family)